MKTGPISNMNAIMAVTSPAPQTHQVRFNARITAYSAVTSRPPITAPSAKLMMYSPNQPPKLCAELP